MGRVHPPNIVYRFAVRWFVSALGLWVAAAILGSERIGYDGLLVIVIAGFMLALVNAIIKPFVVLLSLPAILFTLGLFVIVINGLMVMLAAWVASNVYAPLEISSIWSAMLAGMIIGLVNYLVTAILEDR